MGWNGSGGTAAPQKPKVTPKKPSPARGIVAGGLVCVLAVGAYFAFFSGGEKPQAEKTTKERARIKEVTPAAVPKAEPEKPKKPVDPREDYDHSKFYRDERGILRTMTGCRAYDPTRKAHKPNVAGSNERIVFSNIVDRQIAGILQMSPGDHSLVKPDYSDPEFLKQFQESLLHKITIKDDDPEWDKEIKQSVIDVKKELVERMAQGEKLGDILNGAMEEIERLTQYKNDLEKQVRTLIADKDGEFSESDVKELVAAANKMFEEKGIDPVSEDEFVSQNIRLIAAKQGLTKPEIESAVQEYHEKRELENIEKEEQEAAKEAGAAADEKGTK